MANLGLHSGILTHQSTMLTLPSQIDKRNLLELEGPKEHTHIGTVDMWAFKRKTDAPFLNIAGIGSNNIVYSESGFVTYDVNAASDQSISIVEDITGSVEVGRNKQPFEMLVNSDQLGGPGKIFKFDPLGKDEYMVVSQPRKAGEHSVYTVKRLDSNEPVNKVFLQATTKLHPSIQVISPEFGQEFGGFSAKTFGNNKFIVPVGQAMIQTSYHVSSEVARVGTMNISSSLKKQFDKMFEYQFLYKDSEISKSGLTTFEEAAGSPAVSQYLQGAIKEGRVTVAISSFYDSLAIKDLMSQENKYQMYGTGGYPVTQSGVDEILLPVGAWQQMDTGYKTRFNISTFNLNTLKEMIRLYMHGKVDYPDAGKEQTMVVQTGMGGMELINKVITEAANSQALIVHANMYGNITGDALNLKYTPSFYKEITIPMLAHLKFLYNPAFDPIEENPVVNPTVGGGYKLSSYSFIIHGENEFGGSSNIKLLRTKNGGGQVFMNVINGRNATHPLFKQQTSINGTSVSVVNTPNYQNGYTASFEKFIDTLHLVDPTRILKAVPINPITKSSW
jgi:hypothetical protein